MSRKVLLTSATVVLALVACAAALLVAVSQKAEAAFPGINGKIVFVRDLDGSGRSEDPEIFTISFTGDNLQRLTNNTKIDQTPAWSPDGKKIVYSSGGRAWNSYRDDVFVMNASGSNKTRIRDERSIAGQLRGSDRSPSFSPSGRQIVFIRVKQFNPAVGSYDTGDVYKIGADGTNLTRLRSGNYYPCCTTWSPGGTKIAYSDVYDYYDPDSVVTMNSDGSDRRFITEGSSPDWSPDGSQIVFIRSGEIFKINAGGTDEKQLTDNSVFDGDPAFSPGGGKIVFSSYRYGASDLYIMDADGTNERQLTYDPAGDSAPNWQPVQQGGE